MLANEVPAEGNLGCQKAREAGEMSYRRKREGQCGSRGLRVYHPLLMRSPSLLLPFLSSHLCFSSSKDLYSSN